MPTLTLADIQNRILARIDNNTALFPVVQINDSINEAIKLLNLMTGFIQGTASVTSVANQTFYGLPSPILIPLKVQFNGTYLGMLNLNEVGQTHPMWLSDTTVTIGAPTENWIPFGLGQYASFGIWPADGVGGGTLTVTGILEPTPLINTTDVVQIPNEQVESLDTLAFSSLVLKETATILQQGFDDYKRYQRQVKKIKIWQSLAQPSMWNPEGRQSGKP